MDKVDLNTSSLDIDKTEVETFPKTDIGFGIVSGNTIDRLRSKNILLYFFI